MGPVFSIIIEAGDDNDEYEDDGGDEHQVGAPLACSDQLLGLKTTCCCATLITDSVVYQVENQNAIGVFFVHIIQSVAKAGKLLAVNLHPARTHAAQVRAVIESWTGLHYNCMLHMFKQHTARWTWRSTHDTLLEQVTLRSAYCPNCLHSAFLLGNHPHHLEERIILVK